MLYYCAETFKHVTGPLLSLSPLPGSDVTLHMSLFRRLTSPSNKRQRNARVYERSSSSIGHLPVEILREIYDHLPPASQCALRGVNRFLRESSGSFALESVPASGFNGLGTSKPMYLQIRHAVALSGILLWRPRTPDVSFTTHIHVFF
jgi:hypothetical protein